MSKNKQGKKHIHILDGMSLYTRDKSPYFWGYLNLDGEIHKKSLKTSDMKEAEKLLFDWKNELLYSDSIEATNTNADVTATKIPKVDNTRRKALMITSSLMGAVTVAGFAVPFLSAWNPSEKAKALGASVKFDLSKLEPGAMAVVEWRRTPIFVVHQTPKALENLPKLNDRVTDPVLSEGVARSTNDRFTVLKGVCTQPRPSKASSYLSAKVCLCKTISFARFIWAEPKAP